MIIDISDRHIDIPVALVVFNRLDCAKANIDSIRTATPSKLYIISDGPRENVVGEREKVDAVRKAVEDGVDWPCEVIRIYSDVNLGCDKRSVTGYNEVFKNEEMAILIEDDSIADESFFPFCAKMLEYYKDDTRIMMVSGANLVPDCSDDEKDYYFSAMPIKYAWGTWKRAWKYHTEVTTRDFTYDRKWLSRVFTTGTKRFYEAALLRCKMHQFMNWDAEWDCAMISQKGLGIVPAQHLIDYIGGDREDATHPVYGSHYNRMISGRLKNTISVRNNVTWDNEYDKRNGEYLITTTQAFLNRTRLAYIIHSISPRIYEKIAMRFK